MDRQQGHVGGTYLDSLERDISQVEADIVALHLQPVVSRQRAYALVGAEKILHQLELTRSRYYGLTQEYPWTESL